LIVTQVNSFCKKRESSLVTIVSQRDSDESPKIVSRVTDSSHAITDLHYSENLNWAAQNL